MGEGKVIRRGETTLKGKIARFCRIRRMRAGGLVSLQLVFFSL